MTRSPAKASGTSKREDATSIALRVTAEGIEQTAQGRELLAHGCEQGQGFLYSHAVPAAQTAAFFRQTDSRSSAGA